MNKKIEKLVSKNNFSELYRIVESKTIKPNLQYKNLKLTNVDFEHLKKFIIGYVHRVLHSRDAIPPDLINLSALMGEEHMDTLKIFICNFVVSKKMLIISDYVQETLQNISSLGIIFDYIESVLESTYKEYENVPSDWDLDLLILTRSITLIKDIICQYFFNNEIDPSILSEALLISIAFEKKLHEFFNIKKCCLQSNQMASNINVIQNNAKCVHERMLSSLFVPFLDIFIDHKLSKYLNIKIDQSTVVNRIIKSFIDFFKDLEYLYEVLFYFEEKNIFDDLFTISDNILLTKLQRIKIEDSPSKIINLYTTILFIQKVIEEFSSKLSERFSLEFISKSLAASRKIERSIDSRIERELISLCPDDMMRVPTVITNCFDDFEDFDDEVKKNILEICMVHQLLKISKMKLNKKKAEEILNQISDLEKDIIKQFHMSPSTGLIKDYIRIFICPIDNPKEFIENFNKLSLKKFDLTQILRVLDDQVAAQEIYQFAQIK